MNQMFFLGSLREGPPCTPCLRGAIGFLLLFSTGCVTLPSAQSARTLAPGAERYGASVGFMTLQRSLAPEWLAFAADQGLPVDYVHLHLWYRHGVGDRMDVGLSTLSFMGYGADFKWMMFDSPRLSLSTGLAVGVFLPVILPVYYFELGAPVFLTYRPAPRLSLTGAIRVNVNMGAAKTRQLAGGRYRTEGDAEGGGAFNLTAIYAFRPIDLVIDTGLSRHGFLWFGVGLALRRGEGAGS